MLTCISLLCSLEVDKSILVGLLQVTKRGIIENLENVSGEIEEVWNDLQN